MRNESDYYSRAGSGMGGLLLGIVIGAMVGGVAALLLAPKSGRETREMIKEKAVDAGHMVQERARDIRGRFSNMKDQMEARAEEEVESIKR